MFQKIRIFLVVCVLISVSCSFISRLQTGVGVPPPSPGDGLIVYLGVDGNIYTTDRVGQRHVAITDDANLSPAQGEQGRIYQHPAWSPDGSTVAFVGYSGSSAFDQQATLYAVNAEGGNLREPFQSSEFFPFYLYWSPDSQAVTFLSNSPDGAGLTLHLAQVAGAGSKILGTGEPFYWAWAPDNESILIHTGGSASTNTAASLAFLSVGDASQASIALRPASFQSPDWRPGGEALALAVENGDGQNALVIVDQSGAVKDSLAPLASPSAFGWSPRGDRLAYTGQSEGRASNVLNVVEVTTGLEFGQSRLIDRNVISFFWSPDGEKIAFFTISPSRSGGALMLRRAQASPSISLDMYVVTLQTGESRLLASFNPADAFLETIPFFDQYQRSSSFWSPDSRSLVIAARGSDVPPGIFVVDVASGQSTRIADGEVAFWSQK